MLSFELLFSVKPEELYAFDKYNMDPVPPLVTSKT